MPLWEPVNKPLLMSKLLLNSRTAATSGLIRLPKMLLTSKRSWLRVCKTMLLVELLKQEVSIVSSSNDSRH